MSETSTSFGLTDEELNEILSPYFRSGAILTADDFKKVFTEVIDKNNAKVQASVASMIAASKG